MVNTGIMVF